MAKAMVKCVYCGVQFDRKTEPFIKVNERRYAHKECSENYCKKLTQDEIDYLELEKYIKKLFKIKTLSAKIRKQIKNFREEYEYTYTGMQKTLFWWFEIRKNDLNLSQGGIGIIPYVYEDALNYYYGLYLAKIANENMEFCIPKTKIVEIAPPICQKRIKKLFDFEKDK